MGIFSSRPLICSFPVMLNFVYKHRKNNFTTGIQNIFLKMYFCPNKSFMKYILQSTIFFYQNWNEIESPSSHSPLYLNLVGSSACVTLALQNGIFISMKNGCLVTIFLEFIIWFVWTKNVTKTSSRLLGQRFESKTLFHGWNGRLFHE